jgi:hypothetical protein
MMCGGLAPHAVVVVQTFTGRVSESPTAPRYRCWLSSNADQRVWPGDASLLAAG